MNYIILLGTGLVQKNRIRNSKLFLSAFLGTLYSIVEYLKIIPVCSNVLFKVMLSNLMIYVAFNPQSVNKMLKSLILFYLITFATGGCAIGILYMLNPKDIIIKNGIILVKNPYKLSIVAGAIAFIIIQYAFYNNKRKLNSNDMICDITIKICGKLVNTKAFIDSGNNLMDPYTKEPVVIVEKRCLEKIVNLNKDEMLEGGDNNLKIRWIPYKSIGKNNGMLMGIKVDYIEVEYENEKTIVNNVTVGIYNKTINDKYSALIGLNLIDGGNKNEYNVNTKKNIF